LGQKGVKSGQYKENGLKDPGTGRKNI
jgi:hypothetical protein